MPSKRSQNWVEGPDLIKCVDQLDPEGDMIGYARVSTNEQELDLQISALKDAGCVMIFMEKQSTRKERPVWERVKNMMARGNDTLVIYRLDRLGRDLIEMVQTVEYLYEKQVKLRSLQENVDPSTASGRLMLNIIASFAQYERDLTRERTIAGMAEAKARGVELGHPTDIHGEKKLKMLIDIWNLDLTNEQITKRAGYKSTATLFNHFRGVRKQVRIAKKQGEEWFESEKMDALIKCAQEEGISDERLNAIIDNGEPSE